MSVAAPLRPGGLAPAPTMSPTPAFTAPPMPDVPLLATRKPTGMPPYPTVLVAGVAKSGKSWAAVEFSGSPLVGRTFYFELGEGYIDAYGAVPGADFDIAIHDGTYRGIGNAIWAATKQPQVDGRPNAIVVDNVSLLWDMLTAEAQAIANRRRKQPSESEAVITMDLWNVAKKRWNDLLDLLRAHNGPVILIARLEHVTLVDAAGNPTTKRDWKVKAEKNLPFEVDVVVQMPGYRTFEVSGVRSVHLQVPPGEKLTIPDFTLDALMRALGLHEPGVTAPRAYVPARPDAADAMTLIEPAPPARPSGPVRSRPTAPEYDEWSTPPLPAPAPERQARLIELFDMVGPADPRERASLVADIVGRPVAFVDLSAAQVEGLIEYFEQLLVEAEVPEATDRSGPAEPVVSDPGEPVAVLGSAEPEAPRARPGVEDYAEMLAKVTSLEAVARVEKLIFESFHGTTINGTLFVDLVEAAAARRAELGEPATVNAAAVALAAILTRAANTTRKVEDIAKIQALIRQRTVSGALGEQEGQSLLAECRRLFTDISTRGGQGRSRR